MAGEKPRPYSWRSCSAGFSLKVLLENLLRMEDGRFVRKPPGHRSAGGLEAQMRTTAKAFSSEIAFMPARVLLQDFTGVPAVVRFGRDARRHPRKLGGDPKKINPLLPAELVIDHSVQVDKFGSDMALRVQRGTRNPAQRRALRLSALGTEKR
jgi:aconitate hydratase